MAIARDSICYRALATRDARFDGRLFVGVVTTGVYCRPICPARTPKRENERFLALRGVGLWTAQYWALRALRDSDAFPAGDAGLLRSPALANGTPLTAKTLLQRAENWRPWRAYAAQHLWTADGAGRNGNERT